MPLTISKIALSAAFLFNKIQMFREIHDEKVYGANIDAQTRCVHYHGEPDIIAVKFKCCGKWFSCFECHAEGETHAPQVWAADEFQTKAVLCGKCGHQLKIAEYFDCDSICPKCGAKFNPNCSRHYTLYFEMAETKP